MTGWFWPNAPVDHWRPNDRSRGIAAFGNAKLNESKGTIAQLDDRYRGAGEATRLEEARQYYDDRQRLATQCVKCRELPLCVGWSSGIVNAFGTSR